MTSPASSFSFFMGSQVCHITSFFLCSRGVVEASELQLYVAEAMAGEGKPVSLHIINSCVAYLKRRGLVAEEVEETPELRVCLKKRSKRYCMRAHPTRVLLRASPLLCEKLVAHAQAQGALSGWEAWPVWNNNNK